GKIFPIIKRYLTVTSIEKRGKTYFSGNEGIFFTTFNPFSISDNLKKINEAIGDKEENLDLNFDDYIWKIVNKKELFEKLYDNGTFPGRIKIVDENIFFGEWSSKNEKFDIGRIDLKSGKLKIIGYREHPIEGFCVSNNEIKDFGQYGVYDTKKNRKILDLPVSSLVSFGNKVMFVSNGEIYLADENKLKDYTFLFKFGNKGNYKLLIGYEKNFAYSNNKIYEIGGNINLGNIWARNIYSLEEELFCLEVL
ncbi:MAG: hypothetical protein QXL97_00690, partial [Candidatus Aenigmatarchaeota archaeon]